MAILNVIKFIIIILIITQTIKHRLIIKTWKVLTRRLTPISVRPLLTYEKLDQRKNEADRIRERYPDRIPVICEKSRSSKLPDIDKTK